MLNIQIEEEEYDAPAVAAKKVMCVWSSRTFYSFCRHSFSPWQFIIIISSRQPFTSSTTTSSAIKPPTPTYTVTSFAQKGQRAGTRPIALTSPHTTEAAPLAPVSNAHTRVVWWSAIDHKLHSLFAISSSLSLLSFLYIMYYPSIQSHAPIPYLQSSPNQTGFTIVGRRAAPTQQFASFSPPSTHYSSAATSTSAPRDGPTNFTTVGRRAGPTQIRISPVKESPSSSHGTTSEIFSSPVSSKPLTTFTHKGQRAGLHWGIELNKY